MWERIGPFLLIFLGISFLLDNFGIPFFDFGDLINLWPLILIWLGYSMLRDDKRKREKKEDPPTFPQV